MAAADLARSVKVEWKCQSASKTASTASFGESKLTATERGDVEQSPATVRQLAPDCFPVGITELVDLPSQPWQPGLTDIKQTHCSTLPQTDQQQTHSESSLTVQGVRVALCSFKEIISSASRSRHSADALSV